MGTVKWPQVAPACTPGEWESILLVSPTENSQGRARLARFGHVLIPELITMARKMEWSAGLCPKPTFGLWEVGTE